MSDLIGLIAISALGATASFVVFYKAKMTNDLGDQIVTGFVGGHPIPATQRWIMLYSRFVSYVTAAVAVSVFLALAAVSIANHVGSADVKLLGYFIAFLAAMDAFVWLIQGSVMFFSYRSLLRQAEAD